MSNHSHVFKGSSSLKSCEYDHEKGCMTIEFQSGQRYRYPDCSQEMFTALTNAESAGKHFQKHIRHLKAEKL